MKRATHRQSGFTLIELMVVIAIVASMAALGVTGMQGMMSTQRTKDSARKMADLLMVSRAEAIRSGDPHIVFFSTDNGGDPLLNSDGDVVAALAIRDTDGNGEIGSGEHFSWVEEAVSGTDFGHSLASLRAEGDPAGDADAAPASTVTFSKPDGTAASWVAFLPDGTPRAYVADTDAGTGSVGSGAGAIYVTNGERDYAVVLTPLGAVQVQAWLTESNEWRR